jgi:Cell wall-associated hydrolases (invasion-associated proteins)
MDISNIDNMSISEAQALGTTKVNELLKLNNLTTDTGEEAETVNNIMSAPNSIIKKYGIIQDVIIKSSKEDPLLKARRILNENCKPKESIEVECIGDVTYRVGFGVHLIAPFLKGYEDRFMYIKEVQHEWKSDSLFISKLTLTPSRVMDEIEWNDLGEEDEESTGTDGSDLWKKIYALLRQQEGKDYIYGAAGPDTFDCSGLVQYCYNQYSDELGLTLGRTTYEQCKQGIEVDKDDKNQWNPGDLLFWYASPPYPGHVSIYIGGNKMIHAPKTGDVVKTVDITRTDIYSVRRVIKDIASADIKDDNIPSDYTIYLGAVEGNCNTFIVNMKKYEYKNSIINKSYAAGVDPYLTAAIIAIESEGNPTCGGSYYGLMQVENGSSDPAANIEKGLNEYNRKRSAVGIQIHVILSAYNSGEGTVEQACKQNGYNMSTVTVKQLGDALYDYVKAHNPTWNPSEKKYYSSKVLKAYSILKSKKALN